MVVDLFTEWEGDFEEGGIYSSMDDTNEWYIYRSGRLIELEPEEVKLMFEKADAGTVH